MTRVVRIFVRSIGTLALCVFVIFIFSVVVMAFPGDILPYPMTIERHPNYAVVHFETLGEYPTTARKISIVDTTSGLTIFELKEDGNTLQIWKFKLLQEQNSTRLVAAAHGSYHVITPASADTFFIKPGVDYRVTIWGKRWPTHETIRF